MFPDVGFLEIKNSKNLNRNLNEKIDKILIEKLDKNWVE